VGKSMNHLSESRMRENRPSGLMRGGRSNGHWSRRPFNPSSPAYSTNFMNANQKTNLVELAKSLQAAFSEEMEATLLEGGKELKLKIGAKTAWIDEDGRLSGETSRISSSGFEVCVPAGADAVTAWNRLLNSDREFCRFFALCLSFWPSLAGRQ
ncbi:MAG: hypothetical protein LV480_01320, partial [Methylacidiphilales bacterium]|nr:hypothetical protein [Candidatus Methylacidiphilales bacterium]